MTWNGLVLLLADDGCTRVSSGQEVTRDALWAGGKEDVLGSSGWLLHMVWYTVSTTSRRHTESGKAGVGTL